MIYMYCLMWIKVLFHCGDTISRHEIFRHAMYTSRGTNVHSRCDPLKLLQIWKVAYTVILGPDQVGSYAVIALNISGEYENCCICYILIVILTIDLWKRGASTVNYNYFHFKFYRYINCIIKFTVYVLVSLPVLVCWFLKQYSLFLYPCVNKFFKYNTGISCSHKI